MQSQRGQNFIYLSKYKYYPYTKLYIYIYIHKYIYIYKYIYILCRKSFRCQIFKFIIK